MVGDFERRKSQPEREELVTDPDEIARVEAENGLRQTKFIEDTIEQNLQAATTFSLRPSLISSLNRLAIQGLSELPGIYRPGGTRITNSNHIPPIPEDVPRLMEEMCDYVNDHWHRDAWHLASYLMWRLNWIHPFEDGNGRTSRAISYIVLCLKLGQRLPGSKTIPEVISEKKRPYYDAIDKADAAAKQGKIDVTAMETVLKNALAAQLADFADTVTGGHLTGNARPGGNEGRQQRPRWTARLHEHYNNHPFWYWFAPAILAVVGVLISVV
ncbi:MAG: Fic family protein [Alphaproteobacteria bacterium]|nr:Fic family protein [Alphaproteobacteria bacterium]